MTTVPMMMKTTIMIIMLKKKRKKIMKPTKWGIARRLVRSEIWLMLLRSSSTCSLSMVGLRLSELVCAE
jgi:hypothetical protein